MTETKQTLDVKVNENWTYLDSRWQGENEIKQTNYALRGHKKNTQISSPTKNQ